MMCPVGATNSTGEVLKTCSGHGRCMTLREMGGVWTGNDNLDFEGLVFKPRDYNLWDADQIQGCVCDPPYTGHNCSLKACPYGDDYSIYEDQYGIRTHNEVMRWECSATSGSFRFSFRGVSSDEIPFDAPVGRLKYILEKMTSISSVSISMTSSTVCGNGVLTTTTIDFLDQVGTLPAAKITPQDNLDVGNGGPGILNMITQFVLKCPMLKDLPRLHPGGIHLKYDGEVTRFINYTATVVEVESAIRNLTSVRHYSDYGHINVTAGTVTPSLDGGVTWMNGVPICSYDTHVNTTIEFRSLYGNVHALDVIDGIDYNLGPGFGLDANVTMFTSKGTTHAKSCSGRGRCDFKSGTCDCFYQTTPFVDIKRRFESSDGNGNSGTKVSVSGSRRTSLVTLSSLTRRFARRRATAATPKFPLGSAQEG